MKTVEGSQFVSSNKSKNDDKPFEDNSGVDWPVFDMPNFLVEKHNSFAKEFPGDLTVAQNQRRLVEIKRHYINVRHNIERLKRDIGQVINRRRVPAAVDNYVITSPEMVTRWYRVSLPPST